MYYERITNLVEEDSEVLEKGRGLSGLSGHLSTIHRSISDLAREKREDYYEFTKLVGGVYIQVRKWLSISQIQKICQMTRSFSSFKASLHIYTSWLNHKLVEFFNNPLTLERKVAYAQV